MRHSRVRSAASVLLLLAGLAAGCTSSSPPQRIEIKIHYSQFDPGALTVPRGVPITFVLVNEDPIDHEWLIGDAAFHDRHRHGTEAQHGALPNEVSVAALSTEETTLTFAEPGVILYICHFPGHEAYGMVGTLTVT
jgi:uncharacterized cupredoxin-like copper-binding protein